MKIKQTVLAGLMTMVVVSAHADGVFDSLDGVPVETLSHKELNDVEGKGSWIHKHIIGNSFSGYFGPKRIDPYSLGTNRFYTEVAGAGNHAFRSSPGFNAGVAAISARTGRANRVANSYWGGYVRTKQTQYQYQNLMRRSNSLINSIRSNPYIWGNF